MARKQTEIFKKRGGPYTAKPIYGSKDAWFYTNGGSVTIVVQPKEGSPVSCKITRTKLKKAVEAMS